MYTVFSTISFSTFSRTGYLAHVPSEIFIKLKRIYQSSSNHTYLFLCLISINVMFCHMVACDIESKVQFGSRQNIAPDDTECWLAVEKQIANVAYHHSIKKKLWEGRREKQMTPFIKQFQRPSLAFS
ncbi:hypothetical protein MRB53_018780 [Persea americana]|uniref:Uncharacterized protein n=1 Tax=Persea americana TaxID=3435 RepID=A0ACC2M8E8_PERAE|nr:hypothetical protein MRB53_018780 [Persea americana]